MPGHQHSHDNSNLNSNKLLLVFVLTFIFFIVEVIGGILSNSLALLADAGHMLQDVISLGIASFALVIAKKPRNFSHTFGFKRAEVIAAFVNGLSLIILSLFIFLEALNRMNSVYDIKLEIMFIVAILGLGVNLFAMFIIYGQKNENLNVKGAYLHILGDTLGSIGAIVASILIYVTGVIAFDLLVSGFITVLILFSAINLLKDSTKILMESAPDNFTLPLIESTIKESDNRIISVHDTHIWSTSLNKLNFSCHLIVEGKVEPCKLLDKINVILFSKYAINHSTIQIEHTNAIIECGSC